MLSYDFSGALPIMVLPTPPKFKTSDDVCDWLADLPVSMRWAIVEGMMLKSMIDLGADTQVIKGETGNVAAWLLVGTRAPTLIESLLPILEKNL